MGMGLTPDHVLNPVFHWCCLILLALVWRRRILLVGLLAYILLVLFSPFPSWAIRGLEQKFALAEISTEHPSTSSGHVSSQSTATTAVVVLGGGTLHYQTKLDDYLVGPSFSRVLAGIRLLKKINGNYVIYSGFTAPSMLAAFASEGDSFSRLAEELGVPASKILIEGESRTTYENCKNTSELLGKMGIRNFQLVTSAYHMDRSLRCMRAMGFNPEPKPSDYMVLHRPQTWYLYEPWTNLRFYKVWLHEVVGSWYYRVRYGV